jgi:hypothetical protein
MEDEYAYEITHKTCGKIAMFYFGKIDRNLDFALLPENAMYPDGSQPSEGIPVRCVNCGELILIHEMRVHGNFANDDEPVDSFDIKVVNDPYVTYSNINDLYEYLNRDALISLIHSIRERSPRVYQDKYLLSWDELKVIDKPKAVENIQAYKRHWIDIKNKHQKKIK